MFRALWCGLICVVVTVLVSLMTKPKPEKELVGLVYGCTEIPSEGDLPLVAAASSSGPAWWWSSSSLLQIIFW